MPRRASPGVRPIENDPVHGSRLVQQVINKVMVDGKKSLAERIVYDALEILSRRTSQPPVEALERLRLPRWAASLLVVLSVLAAVVAFLVISGASLASQGRVVGERLLAIEKDIVQRLPPYLAFTPYCERAFLRPVTPEASSVPRTTL